MKSFVKTLAKSVDRKIALAVLIPILSLIALTGYKHFVRTTGTQVELPISGYDPRDLLAGHYLIYTVNYGVLDECLSRQGEREAYICLTQRFFSFEKPEACATFIKGSCRNGRFEAGIEKFFIPQSDAPQLEIDVREKKASIVLSVMSSGTAQVKELLIDGKSWKKSTTEPQQKPRGIGNSP